MRFGMGVLNAGHTLKKIVVPYVARVGLQQYISGSVFW
jgi:hypothetical protein